MLDLAVSKKGPRQVLRDLWRPLMAFLQPLGLVFPPAAGERFVVAAQLCARLLLFPPTVSETAPETAFEQAPCSMQASRSGPYRDISAWFYRWELGLAGWDAVK